MAALDKFVLSSPPDSGDEERAFRALQQAHGGDSFNLVQAAEVLSRSRVRLSILETMIARGTLELAD